MFRPAKMVWVDMLVDRDAVPAVLEILGKLQIMELRQYDRTRAPFEIVRDRTVYESLLELERRLQAFSDHLPRPDVNHVHMRRRNQPSNVVLPELEKSIDAWIKAVAPVVEQLRECETKLEESQLLAKCLESLPDEQLEVGLLSGTSARVFSPFLAVGREADLQELATQVSRVITRSHPMHGEEQAEQRVVVMGVADSEELRNLERRLHTRGMRFARVPESLSGNVPQALKQVRETLSSLGQDLDKLRSQLETTNQRLHMAGELWLLKRHRWVNEALVQSLTGKRFVWLGGWIPVSRFDELTNYLQSSGAPFLISEDRAGEHGSPPILLDNPRWIRRFETFVQGFGVPAADDVDPSPLLALMTPLMFGYMFGDVGQGAVLMLVGWFGRKHLPILELLVAGGFSAVVFGFLFGSVFSHEHLITPLWMNPMQDPLLILLLPIGFGWLVILISMALSGLQAHWHRESGRWWATEAPIIVLYLALPLALLSTPLALATAAISLLWIAVAAGFYGFRTGGIARALVGVGSQFLELLEIIFQLLINTLSFARLGAFSLAHAGLSAAVIALSTMPDGLISKVIIFIIGNAIVITLEGLVVSIQTTRLVMFEFFRRFVVGHGQPFRPLQLPNSTYTA